MRILLAALLLLPACKQRGAPSDLKATPEDRKVIGAAVPLSADGLAFDEEDYKTLRGRREAAWRVVEKVLAPVPIGRSPDLPSFAPEQEATLPLWQTWYDSGEFVELFKKLYTGLGKDARAAKRPFCPGAVRDAFDAHATKSLKGWTSEKLERRLGQLKSLPSVHGLSGKGVTLFSPGVFQGLFQNYDGIRRCADTVKDVERGTLPPVGPSFSHCLNPEMPNGRERALALDPAQFTHCPDVSPDAPTLDYARDGVAVAMKTAWNVAHREDLAVFDTNAAALTKHINNGEWVPARVRKDAELPPSDVYTIRLEPNGREYWLVGLHLAVKTLRHWLWITIWWSDRPGTDFGQDRPESLKAMGPWSHYKMCVTSDYKESDTDPAKVYARSHPSLAAAIRASSARDPGFSWCSNPYIELGKGNSRTNCIGCHQHAGSAEDPDEVFKDDPADAGNSARRALFPHDGRASVRANLPADYLWSITESPDYFATKIRGKAYEIDLNDQ